jgi:hypothetical protein
MSYIGSTPTTQSFIAGTDYFNGNGSTVNFTLSRSVNSVNDIEVIVNNVEQIPSGYSVSGTTLTFSAAPSAGTSNVYVRYLSTTNLSLAIPAGTSATFNTVTVADGSATTPSITNDGDTNTGIFFPAADTIAFAEGGVEAVRIDNSGNVGIGTSSPNAASRATILSSGTSTSAFGNVALRLSSNGSGYASTLVFSDEVANSAGISMVSGNLVFGAAGFNTERMRIDSSGNLLVGTTTANTKFVVGATTTTGAEISAYTTNSSGGTSSSFSFWRNYTGGGTSPFRAAYISNINVDDSFNSNNAQALGFYTKSGTSEPAERARISSTGNVSVGSPFDLSYKMALVSTSTSSPALYLRSTAAGDAGTAQLRLIKADNTNNTSQIFIQFVVDGNNTGSGQINANGASQAAFGSFSDARLKENIVDLPLQLSNIMALRPVEFDYKDGCGHQIGFIAQEMEQVYPDAIGVGENEMLTITGWSKTEARLVKAIQEQQALITALTTRITALENNNATQ